MTFFYNFSNSTINITFSTTEVATFNSNGINNTTAKMQVLYGLNVLPQTIAYDNTYGNNLSITIPVINLDYTLINLKVIVYKNDGTSETSSWKHYSYNNRFYDLKGVLCKVVEKVVINPEVLFYWQLLNTNYIDCPCNTSSLIKIKEIFDKLYDGAIVEDSKCGCNE